jgi:dolichol-phosphate mannosyltransferase
MDNRVLIIDFTRNFGKEAALAAGVLASADSDAVITIDADLQHPPALISVMLEKWEAGAEVVIAIREENLGHTWFRRRASKLFSLIMSKISQTDFIRGSTDFRLYDQQVVKQFSMFKERIRIFRALIDWMGFRKDYIYFCAPERVHGNSVYSKSKLFKLALDGITTFSLWPLKIVGIIGILITLISFCLLIVMVFNYFISSVIIYTPLAIFVVANTFLIGLVLTLIGLVALYVGNIQTEVLARPLYIARKRNN